MTTWRLARDHQDNRLQHRPWADPKLLVGGLLVLGATVLGAWLVSSGDDRVSYWALGEDVIAGQEVTEGQLVQTRAILDEDTAQNALRTDQELPDDLSKLRWAGDLSSGTLLGEDLLTKQSATSIELPLVINNGAAPQDLRRGERVDVWVGPAPGDDAARPATRTLESVQVLSAGTGATESGEGSAKTVIVDVPDTRLDGAIIAQVSAGYVTLVRRS